MNLPGPPSLRRQAVSGVAWSGAQKLAVRATTIGAFVVLGRQLAPADFGTVALASAFVGILTILADLGFASYLVQVAELRERTLVTAFWFSLGLSVGLAALIAGLSPVLADLLGAPALDRVLPVLSVSLVLAGLGSVQTALLQREMRFKELAVRQVVATLAGSTVAITLALLGAGAWALVAQILVRNGVALMVLWRASHWRPGWAFDRGELRAMRGFGVKVLGMNALFQARDRSEELVIATVLGPAALGVWTVARRVLEIVLDVATGVVATVSLPVFARVKADRPRLLRAFAASLQMTSLLMFPILVALAVTSRDLIPLVFGSQWEVSAGLAQVLTIGALLGVLVNYDRSLLLAVDRAGVELATLTGVIASHVVVVLVLAPYGLTAIAWGLVARSAVTLPVRFLVLRRAVGVPLSAYRAVGRVAVAATYAGLVMLGVQRAAQGLGTPVQVLCVLVAGALAYLLGVRVFARAAYDEVSGSAKVLRQRA